jgi:hypothetical protein
MVKGTFWKFFKKIITFQGKKVLKSTRFLEVWGKFLSFLL